LRRWSEAKRSQDWASPYSSDLAVVVGQPTTTAESGTGAGAVRMTKEQDAVSGLVSLLMEESSDPPGPETALNL